MKLSNEAIIGIRCSNVAQARLMTEFDVSWNTVYRWARENAIDGELTKVRVVRLLAEELKMPEDAILIDDKETITV